MNKVTIMKKLLNTACLFVVTIVATVSVIAASTVFGQEKKTADVNPSPATSVTARVDKLFAQWDKPDSPGMTQQTNIWTGSYRAFTYDELATIEGDVKGGLS